MASATDSRYGQKESSDQNFDYMFKILIIGNSSVGKTSFLFRYADDSFTPAFVSTVGIDFKVKTIYRNDKRIKLQIWVGPAGELLSLSVYLPRKAAPALPLSCPDSFIYTLGTYQVPTVYQGLKAQRTVPCSPMGAPSLLSRSGEGANAGLSPLPAVIKSITWLCTSVSPVF